MPPTMTTQAGFAVASCLLALALALSSFERWLVRHRPHELAWAAGLALATVAAAAPARLRRHRLAAGSEVLAVLPRVLAGVASAGGALVLVGGAAWSAWRARRTGGPRRRMVGNGLIAMGTLVLGASGLLNSVV